MSGITKRLKEAVRSSGLSCEDIEARLEMPEGTVKSYITGKEEPDTATIKALAPVLGVSADSILFGVEKIGEMKAMFPNEVTPAPTPTSDWRFLLGVIMLFAGAGGALLMYMMYSAEITSVSMFFEILGWPVILLLAIGVSGLLLCSFSLAIALIIPKKNKKSKKKNNK